MRAALGYIVALVCCIWILHGVEARPLVGTAARLRWNIVALAVVLDVASYAVQGYRWTVLLRPAGHLPWMRSTQAIYAGLFANELLPLRPGEGIRAWLVARWLGAPVRTVVPSIVIERLFDGVCLAGGLGLTLLFVELPTELVRTANMLGVVILAAAVGCAVYLGRSREQSIRALAVALVMSLVVLAAQALAFWLMVRACRAPLGFWEAGAVLLIVHLGTAIPAAPGNLGTYQLACVAGLVVFGVDRTAATNLSLIVFVLLTVPLIAVGSFAFGSSGATLAPGVTLGVRSCFLHVRARNKI
jgi:glycosyltransferase 2 family protein